MTATELRLEPGSAEVVFAQKLASSEPRVRSRALKKLRGWLEQRNSAGQRLSRLDLLKLWKGLYYSLWMQDKPLAQEELIDSLVELGGELGSGFGRRLLFVGVGLETLAREWAALDRWRLDKFLLLLRRLFRSALHQLAAEEKWTPDSVGKLTSLLSASVLSPEPAKCDETLRMHFAGMYLDELDLAAKQRPVPKEALAALLAPYVRIMGSPAASQLLFKAVSKEIFQAMLSLASQELAEKAEKEADDEEDEEKEPEGLSLDYAAVAASLMAVAKSGGLRGSRRAEVYSLVKQLGVAARGMDPLEEEEAMDGAASDLDEDEEVEKAAHRLAAHLRKVPKKRSKPQPQPEDEDDEEQEDDDDAPAAPIKKTKPKTQKTQKMKKRAGLKKARLG